MQSQYLATFMTPAEVRQSAKRGNIIAKELSEPCGLSFRFPHATVAIAMRDGFQTATDFVIRHATVRTEVGTALDYVRQLVRIAKQEIKDSKR